MLRYLLLCLFFLAAGALRAQPCNYDQLLQQGRALLQGSTPQYGRALNKFNAARTCDPSRSEEVDREINRVFRLIEGERDRAVAAEKTAKDARDRAVAAEKITKEARDTLQSALLSVDAERKRAVDAEKTAKEALEKLQATLADVVRFILRDANERILRLDYNDALDKLKNAAEIGVLKDSVAYGLMETAFFYHHSGSPERARESFDLAAKLLGKPTLAVQAGFDAELKRLNAGRAGFLQRRYFPLIQELPGGVFLMGRDSTVEDGGDDELPRHEVRLSPFGLAQTETNFWQWNLYIAAKGRDLQRYSPSWGLWGDNPAVNLDWFDACEYANWLSEREGKSPFYTIDSSAGPNSRDEWVVILNSDGKGYRLPTEAEWEYAARGGPGAPYYTYAGGNDLDSVGWYEDNSFLVSLNRTHPVAGKKPVVFSNGATLYDLSGNVWEWCWDWHGSYPRGTQNNPVGADKGAYRVYRGGGWLNAPRNCRGAIRISITPTNRFSDIGFRLARSSPREIND